MERYITEVYSGTVKEMLVQTLAIKSRLNLLPLKFHRLATEKGAVCLGISVSSSAGPSRGGSYW